MGCRDSGFELLDGKLTRFHVLYHPGLGLLLCVKTLDKATSEVKIVVVFWIRLGAWGVGVPNSQLIPKPTKRSQAILIKFPMHDL